MSNIANTLLNLDGYIQNSFHRSEDYFKKDIIIGDLNEEEILAIVQEAWLAPDFSEKYFPSWFKNRDNFYNNSEVLTEHNSTFANHFNFKNINSVISEYWLNKINQSFFKN